MKHLIALAIVASLSGCASQLQLVSGAESAAAVSLRAAEDIHLDRLRFEMCATPYSALIRNPDFIPGVRFLCLPNGGLTAPDSLLSGVVQP